MAVRLATGCAQAVRNLVHGGHLAGGASLRLRVGIGAGTVHLSDVGGYEGRWEFLASGEPLLEMAEAEHAASPGEIVLSAEAWRHLGSSAVGTLLSTGGWRLERMESMPLPRARLPEPLPQMEAALRAYIPQLVLHRLDAGHGHWLSELRTVSVLFINLGDASFAAGRHPQELQDAIQAIQQALRRYEGASTQVVVDDKGVVVVAAFGLPPLSHEDDATRAILAGCEIHLALGGLGLAHRIGITTGRVFCGTYGSVNRLEYVMVGHVVNMAARLMQAAEGRLLCDASTARLASTALRFKPLPALRVKGRTQPVDVFQPEIPREVPVRGIPVELDPLVDRKLERARLQELVHALVQRRGGVLLLEGEAGLGKSRLLGHLVEVAGAEGLRACVGAGDPLRQSSAYHAWSTALSQLLGLEHLPDIVARTRFLLERLSIRPERRDWAALLNSVLPVAVPESEVVQGMSSALRGANTQELLLELLEVEARDAPVLLLLDDVHWMDAASWELALATHRRIPGLLLVLATRPLGEQAPPEYRQLQERAGTSVLVLNRLPVQDALELVRQTLKVRELPRLVAEFIRERADGHPLFSRELVFALRDAGHLKIDGSECSLSPDAGDLRQLALPETVQGLIISRLDRLTPHQQLLLKVASTLGRTFAVPVLREIYPLADERVVLLEELACLARLGFIQLEALEPAPVYAFKHILIQEAVYQLLSFAQRRQLHRAVALHYERWLEQGGEAGGIHALLAHHWRHAQEPAKALVQLEKAAEVSHARGALRDIIAFLTQAWALAADNGQGSVSVEPLRRARWSTRLAIAYQGLGDVERSLEHFHEGLRLLGKPLLPTSRPGWRILAGVGRQLLHLVLERWLPLPHEDEDRERLTLAARIYSQLGPVCVWRRDFPGFIACILAAINDAERSGNLALVAHAYGGLFNLASTLRLKGLAHRYLQRARLGSASTESAEVCIAEAIVHMSFGRLEQGLRLAERAVELARAVNDRAYLPVYMAMVGVGMDLSRPLAETLAYWEALRSVARESTSSQHETWALHCMLPILLEQERLEEALAKLEEIQALLHQADAISSVAYHQRSALVLCRAGALASARNSAAQALELLRARRPRILSDTVAATMLAEACVELWEKALRSGDAATRELATHTAQACGMLSSLARIHPVVQSRASRLQGERALLMGQRSKARRLFTRALLQAREYNLAPDEARAHLALARLVVDPTSRGEHLRSARDLFARLGYGYSLKSVEQAEASPAVLPPSDTVRAA